LERKKKVELKTKD
jgi:hypothetical protein